MEHQVRFLTAEGREGQHTAANLDEALRFVERLRNSEEANEVRVFRMQEVPIEFRAYYKVELRAGERAGEEGSPVAAEAGSAPSEPVASANGSGDVDGDASPRRLFSRG